MPHTFAIDLCTHPERAELFYQSILAMDADLAASAFRVSHTHLKYTGIVRGLMTAVLIEG